MPQFDIYTIEVQVITLVITLICFYYINIKDLVPYTITIFKTRIKLKNKIKNFVFKNKNSIVFKNVCSQTSKIIQN